MNQTALKLENYSYQDYLDIDKSTKDRSLEQIIYLKGVVFGVIRDQVPIGLGRQ